MTEPPTDVRDRHDALEPWRDMCESLALAGIDFAKGSMRYIDSSDVHEAAEWVQGVAVHCPDATLGALLNITAELVTLALKRPDEHAAVRARLSETVAALRWRFR